ncbi:Hypothetical predicted protein, partial [Paramuricea clavata]
MAEANEKECPRAATILKRDRYVDDLIHSCPSTDEAIKSIEEVNKVLSTGSFKIKEWLCSSTVEKANESEQPKEEDGSESDPHPVTPIVNLDGEEENKTLGPFVGVRVAEIQESWSPSSWRYVPSEENPADDLSRGITVEELSSGRWINGPSFLSKPKTEWPCERTTEPDIRSADPEKKKSPNSLAAIVKHQPQKITKGEQCAKRKVEPWLSPGSFSRKGRCSEKPASQDTEWRTEEIDPEMLHTLGSQ